jgi:hypothetical protein
VADEGQDEWDHDAEGEQRRLNLGIRRSLLDIGGPNPVSAVSQGALVSAQEVEGEDNESSGGWSSDLSEDAVVEELAKGGPDMETAVAEEAAAVEEEAPDAGEEAGDISPDDAGVCVEPAASIPLRSEEAAIENMLKEEEQNDKEEGIARCDSFSPRGTITIMIATAGVYVIRVREEFMDRLLNAGSRRRMETRLAMLKSLQRLTVAVRRVRENWEAVQQLHREQVNKRKNTGDRGIMTLSELGRELWWAGTFFRVVNRVKEICESDERCLRTALRLQPAWLDTYVMRMSMREDGESGLLVAAHAARLAYSYSPVGSQPSTWFLSAAW